MQGSSEDTGLGSLCHRLLCGDINVLSAPRVLALVMCNERRDGRLGTGVQIRLGDTHPHRWTVVITGQDQWTTRREDDEIAVSIVRLWSILAKRRDKDIHQGRVECRQVVIAQPIRRQCPWSI